MDIGGDSFSLIVFSQMHLFSLKIRLEAFLIFILPSPSESERTSFLTFTKKDAECSCEHTTGSVP